MRRTVREAVGAGRENEKRLSTKFDSLLCLIRSCCWNTVCKLCSLCSLQRLFVLGLNVVDRRPQEHQCAQRPDSVGTDADGDPGSQESAGGEGHEYCKVTQELRLGRGTAGYSLTEQLSQVTQVTGTDGRVVSGTFKAAEDTEVGTCQNAQSVAGQGVHGYGDKTYQEQNHTFHQHGIQSPIGLLEDPF